MTLAEQFERYFKFPPHDFQEQVAEHLLAGKNVILQAPTGSGKTEAALAPFLLARAEANSAFPRKMLFATPLRTLAKDLHRRAQNVAAEQRLDVRLHTGEDKGADFLEGDLIVTTIDQVMSAYAHIPLSLTGRLANINAGAVIASYLVFDEFHLHDPIRAFRTALVMAEELKGITPFLFMTATLSDEMVRELASHIGAEVVTVDGKELEAIPSQNKNRFFVQHEGAITARAIADVHERRSLVVCNTVRRAQQLYRELEALKTNGGEIAGDPRIELIHSRFFPSDRNRKEGMLQAWMGKNSTENVILVATQVIEVGIDISCEHLHTELCPANSLLQRAGRCARYEGEIGTVHVYDTQSNKGLRDYAPYVSSDSHVEETVKAWFDDTWEQLPHLIGRNVDFEAEKELVNAVHLESDLESLTNHTSDPRYHRNHLNQARRDDSRLVARAKARDLIRKVEAYSVILHPHPERLDSWGKVSSLEGLNLYHYDLSRFYRRATESDTWGIKIAYHPDTWEEEGRPPLHWREATSEKDIFTGAAVCLNPALLAYSAQHGLRLDEIASPATQSPIKQRKAETWEPHWYTCETYELHIRRVCDAAHRVVPEVFHIAPRVDAALGLPLGTTADLIHAAIAAHDFGKLNRDWQAWTRKWQKRQCETYPGGLWDGEFRKLRPSKQPEGVYCAHTDYHPDKGNDREAARELGKRPSHALESAVLLERLAFDGFLDSYGDDALPLFVAVTRAINTHHGADAKPSFPPGHSRVWYLDKGAERELLRVFGKFSSWQLDTTVLKQLVAKGVRFLPGEDELVGTANARQERVYWLLYSLIARALRLGDQQSFSRQVEEVTDG